MTNVLAIEGDVRDEKTASDAVEAIVHRFGRLDGVISNAGIMIRIFHANSQLNALVSLEKTTKAPIQIMSHVARNYLIISMAVKERRRLHATWTRHKRT
jgi:NAD(P)-dependent dehydrogenase (short-subunit alcohol dehydrogenase family)